ALARPLIAWHQVQVALDHAATAVAHGATGKGNDQVRFELAYAALAPQLAVIAPWKEREFLAAFQGRRDLLAYCRRHGLPIEASPEQLFSMDENLMHKSYEAGVLEDPMAPPPPRMFRLTRSPQEAPDRAHRVELHFRDALPVRLVEESDRGEEPVVEDPLALFERLNELGREHGVGRLDMVENRFVGIKSRGVYETPGATLLHRALRDLEGIAMDREVLRLRDSLSPKFAQLIYNGFWFSPEMDFVRAAFAQAETLIDGRVALELYKGNVTVLGRESPSSLYDRQLASMDVHGGYDQQDARGFIRISALRLRAHRLIVAGAERRGVHHDEPAPAPHAPGEAPAGEPR
ncbi:MAG TPA: argininosuccinate synthase, partial [Thermoanaerobaculia bacterium]|nr:argininosuccinate synthase [Thermoanaerobaculia bacterium]